MKGIWIKKQGIKIFAMQPEVSNTFSELKCLVLDWNPWAIL
jgi:hypothetical protein